jgi:molecular chaperone DnaK (HSP70)
MHPSTHAYAFDATVETMGSSKVDGPAIGIDLGTTYSCVAVWRHDRGEVIANDQGNRLTPSCVAFKGADERLVGDAAFNQAASNPTNTIFGENQTQASCCLTRRSLMIC